MISIKDWMECVDYRISEGSEFCWECFGPNAYSLSFWDQDRDGVSSSITIDTKTQKVYEASVCNYGDEKAYRLINPEYADAYRKEAADRNVPADNAWDHVNFIDLETDEDFLEKCNAIVHYQPYDTRVQIPLELDKEEIFKLMSLAHQRDVTLNELVEDLIRTQLNLIQAQENYYKEDEE